MASIEVKNVNSPDETRPFADKGHADVLNLGGNTILYGTFEPGWRWSEHIKPLAGTETCEATHLLYCIQGRMKVAHTDGSEAEIGPGDVVAIAPDHDAWVVGDEPCISVDFGGYASFAQGS